MKVIYDGKYPNRCSGNLTVIIDGVKHNFPEDCLESGGRAYCDSNWEAVVTEGDWEISEWPKDFPEHLKFDVLEAVNEQIPHGCCGGCI